MIVARYECSPCRQSREFTQGELMRSSFGESLVLDLIHGLPAYARSLSCVNARLDYVWPIPVRYPERLTFQEVRRWALTANRLGNDVPWHTVVRWADFFHAIDAPNLSHLNTERTQNDATRNRIRRGGS